MVSFKMRPHEPVIVKKGHVLEYDKYEYIFNITTWQKVVKYAQDASKQSRDEMHFTFCIPSSCTHKDLEKSLRLKIDLFKDVLPMTLEANVDKRNCQVEREFNFDRADLLYMGIVGSFILFGSFATLYHLFTRLNGLQHLKFGGVKHDVLKAFSFSHTIKKMATVSKNEDGMDCMHGIKAISMFLIIMGHRIMFSISSPVANPIFVENIYRKFEFAMLLNGPIIVDSFFTISGFLACYLILQEIEKRKSMINVIIIYLHRVIRLTPAYAVVLGFYCTIFVQMGDGPFWDERIGVEQERCLASWWANILYINNYVNVDQTCMFQSWYLTCDTHYFLIVPFLAYLLWKKPKVGFFVCGIIIGLSVIVPFIIIYMSQEEPFLLLYMKFLRDPTTNKTFQDIYIPSHMRAGPYFIGALAAYLKFKLKETGYRIPVKVRYFSWIIGVATMNLIFITGFLFYIPTEEKDYLLSGLYGSLHHFLWSICICWGIIGVSEGYGPWLAPYLNWGPWVLLSRITYTAYLCHGAIQLYTAGIARYPIYAGMFNLFNFTASDLVLAYVAGFLLSLVFEAPIMELEKILLRKKPLPSKEDGADGQRSEKKREKKEGIVDIYIPKIPTVYKS
ncbi:hypothetical protein HHI36_011329 [Cryptolaemus montrouzieri]|uniref:Acyltransferase 3 domain-containing protein n=1 Tax=Cryptolaemus montrouzieri TaxID=559131 RepID=A0ABD2MLG6_9CUCU